MEIKVYSIPNCPFCKQLKEILNEKGINYEDIDVSLEENDEIFEKISEISGQDSVPCITVGQHLLAPDVNFYTINQAVNLIEHILKTEQ